jgi:hypothetical protein
MTFVIPAHLLSCVRRAGASVVQPARSWCRCACARYGLKFKGCFQQSLSLFLTRKRFFCASETSQRLINGAPYWCLRVTTAMYVYRSTSSTRMYCVFPFLTLHGVYRAREPFSRCTDMYSGIDKYCGIASARPKCPSYAHARTVHTKAFPGN